MEVRGDRINLPVACNKSMRLIAGGGRTSEDISARTGLSVKAVDLVRAAMSRQGATAERGWESLPDAARFALIKSEYYSHEHMFSTLFLLQRRLIDARKRVRNLCSGLYPTPTKDTWIMARLLADGATGPGSAVRMPMDRGMRDLVRWGHVCRGGGGGFYLAGMGPGLAQEILSMYPEIGRPSFSKSGGAGRRARRLMGEVAPVAPPGVKLGRKGARAR